MALGWGRVMAVTSQVWSSATSALATGASLPCAVSADFHHLRVELVDGSELVADIVDARDELGVILYVAIPPTQPVRLVFTDALGNAKFMEIESAPRFDYRH